tara:strand:- start:83182 stop:84456 length:1275 start_codon:yes stop_codon:yes gene_type:complete
VTALLTIAISTLFIELETTIAGIKIRPFDGVLILILIYVFISPGYKAQRAKIIHTLGHPICMSFLFYLSYQFFNGVLLGSATSSVKELIQASEFLILALLVSSILTSGESRQKSLKVLIICLGIIVIANTAAHIFNGRFSGFKDFGDPKYAYGIFATLMVGVAMTGGNLRSRTFLFSLLACLILLVLSGERKGWLGFVFALIAMAAAADYIRVKTFAKVAIVSILLVAPLSLWLSQFTYIQRQVSSIEQLFSIVTDGEISQAQSYETTISNQARLFIWNFSISQIEEHPIVGIGTERFRPIIQKLEIPNNLAPGAHNEYLRVQVENGIVGLTMLLIFQAAVLRTLYQLRLTHRKEYVVGIGAFTYGSVVNFFMGGGDALNQFYFIFPAIIALSSTLGRSPSTAKKKNAQFHFKSYRQLNNSRTA